MKLTPEQIKLLVERSGVKLPRVPFCVIGDVVKASTHVTMLACNVDDKLYTEDQLHTVIAEMQEKLESYQKNKTNQ